MFIASEDRQPKETHGKARRRSALPTRSSLRGSFYCEQREHERRRPRDSDADSGTESEVAGRLSGEGEGDTSDRCSDIF